MSTHPAISDVTGYIDAPMTKADWDVMSGEERSAIQDGIDELDRGEFISHAEVKLELQRMREKYAAR